MRFVRSILTPLAASLCLMCGQCASLPTTRSYDETHGDAASETLSAHRTREGGFMAVAVVEKNNVWAVGREGGLDDARTPSVILNSTDMGLTWTRKLLIPDCSLFDIWFQTPMVGWAVGSRILHSLDGGQTWREQRAPAKENHLVQVRFITEEKGWALGSDGEVLRTEDGGVHWLMQKLSSGWIGNEFKGWLNRFSFADENNAWIVGDQGQVFQSTDSGANWRSRGRELSMLVKPRKAASVNFKDIEFFSREKGYIIVEVREEDTVHSGSLRYSYQVAVLSTADGGRRWIRQGILDTSAHVRSYFLTEREWWLQTSSRQSLLRTIDGGKSWRAVKLRGNANAGVMLFLDPNTSWLLSNTAGFDGDNLFTSDGGKTWITRKITYLTED